MKDEIIKFESETESSRVWAADGAPAIGKSAVKRKVCPRQPDPLRFGPNNSKNKNRAVSDVLRGVLIRGGELWGPVSLLRIYL